MYREVISPNTPNNRLTTDNVLNNRFKIIGVLGVGGFSITYKAVHIEMDKPVAIKEFFCRDYMYRDVRVSSEIIVPDQSDKKRFQRDLHFFLKEARILAEVTGISGVVHVTDYFRENNTAYIVMDIIEGVSLEELLNAKNVFSWDDIVKKLLPMIKSLSFIHAKGLIHRDIKPSNIIVSDDGTVTLIDFGAALHYTGDESYSVYLSEGYAPKEQYLRSGELGPYTDVYALCAVMYRCITGTIPEHSIQRAVFDELKKPSEMGIQINSEFERILMKGLDIESETRWQNMEEFFENLSSLFSEDKKHPHSLVLICSAVIGAFLISLILIGAYTFTHYHEIKIRQMALNGEAVSFDFEAPEDMTADEFKRAVNVIDERATAFAGKRNYLKKSDLNGITLTIPKECLAYGEDWNIDTILNTCFAFSGKWKVDLPDKTHFAIISPSNILDAEIQYGRVPSLVSSQDEEENSVWELIDWEEEEEGYFLRIQFNKISAKLLSKYLTKEGCVFLVDGYNTSYYWISAGDGETAYFPVGSFDCRNIAETLRVVLMNQGIDTSLIPVYEYIYDNDIAWDVPEREDNLKRSKDEFSETSVEWIYDVQAKEYLEQAKQFCEKQLIVLDIPYAIGVENTAIHIKVPSNKVNQLIQSSLCDGSIDISNVVGDEILAGEIDDAETCETEGKKLIKLNINREDIKMGVTSFPENTEIGQLFLVLNGVKIGTLIDTDQNRYSLTFDLDLINKEPTNELYENMPEYIYNIFTNQDESFYWDSYYKCSIWRDENNRRIPVINTPSLPTGVDISGFDTIVAAVQDLGGEATYHFDHFEESLKVDFDHWTGRFPIDALKLIESIYQQEELLKGTRWIFDNIDIRIVSSYKGNPVCITASFMKDEERPEFVFCTYGKVYCEDEEALSIAEEYIRNSNILSFQYPEDEEEYPYLTEDMSWRYQITSVD